MTPLRTLEGLALLAFLGPQYLFAARLRRWWKRGGTAYRTWLDMRGADWLASYARRRGAMLIKIAQFIATRPDLFPLTYVEACGSLRDQAPPRSWVEVQRVLHESYEGRIDKHLIDIEPDPIAAASFGQVHRAKLPNGSVVAVKIQHHDLGPLVAADLWLTRRALALFKLAFPGWPLDMIYAEIERSASEEQDYLQEGSNADRLRDTLKKHGLYVPVVHWPHTREHVLVMDFAPGTTLARLDIATLSDDERKRIANVLIDGFLSQLLDAGFFHADPHGGNIIYDTTVEGPPRIWLIDFGMTANISAKDMGLYRRFLAQLRENNTDGMVDVLIELGFVMPSADRSRLKAIARDIYEQLAHLDPQSFKGSKRQNELASRINEFLRRIDGLIFPQHTLLLSRATGLLEGNCTQLVPGQGFLQLVRPRLQNISWQAKFDALRAEIANTIKEFRELPSRIEQAVQGTRAPTGSTAIVAAIIFLAAMQVPSGPLQITALCCAGFAALWCLRH